MPNGIGHVAFAHTGDHHAPRRFAEMTPHPCRIEPGIGVDDGHIGHTLRQYEGRRRAIAPRCTEPFERGRGDKPDRFARKAAKSLGAPRPDLVDVARCKYAIAHDHQHPAPGRLGIARNAHRIGKIAQTVIADRIGRPHRAHHDDRLVRGQRLIEQESRFFERIRTMRDDNAGAGAIAQSHRCGTMQRAPFHGTDIRRIDIGDLRARQFGAQTQSANRFEIFVDGDFACTIFVPDCGTRDSRDRAAGGEDGKPAGHGRRLASAPSSGQLILPICTLCAAHRRIGGPRGRGA